MFANMHKQSTRVLAAHDRAFRAWARREMRAGRLVCFLVEETGNKVAGGGSLWLREVQPHPGFAGGKVPYLMSMYTYPACRGKGIATTVVRHALAWSKARGYDSVSLHASKMGRPIYEKLGWKATSEMDRTPSGGKRQSLRPARRLSRRSGRCSHPLA